MRMTKKSRDSLKRNTKKTRLTSEIPAQYLVRLPIQTYARQYRLGSETCKTPGWAKRLMKSSPLQTERIWFFDALKTVYGPQSSRATPLLSADGTSAEHFDGVLNRPSSIHDEAINRLPQVECNPLLDELPAVSETVKTIKLLSSGKVLGSDAIPAEIYKAGGPPVAKKLTELFHIMWRKGHPSRIQGCNNYPPIKSSSLWQSSRHLLIYGIRLDTKLKVYRSVVLPTLLYACETWTVYQWHAKRLNHFHTSCLRKLLNIKTGFQTQKSQGCRVYILFCNWHN